MRILIVAPFLLLLNGTPALAQINLGFPKEARHSVPMPGSGLLTGSALFAPQGAGRFRPS